MNELLHDRSADDAVIARLRAALDEVTAGTGDAAVPPPRRAGLSVGRWFAIAAATVLVIGATVAVAVNRSNAPDTASAPTDSPTTAPAPTTTVTEPTLVRVETPWYTLLSPDLVPGEIVDTEGDPTAGVLTMVWARNAGLMEGMMVLTEVANGHSIGGDGATTGTVGSTEVTFRSYGLDDAKLEALAAQVVPGSGLPYVLPVDGWQLLALGRTPFSGEVPAGSRLSQEFSNEAGVVTLSVGEYAGELEHLLSGYVAPVVVAGNDGWQVTDQYGTWVVWPAGNSGQWASLEIPAAFADRVDGLIAAVAEVDPTQPTAETVPAPDNGASSTPTSVLGSLRFPAIGDELQVVDGRGLDRSTALTSGPMLISGPTPSQALGAADPSIIVMSRTTLSGLDVATVVRVDALFTWTDVGGDVTTFEITVIETCTGADCGASEPYTLVIEFEDSPDRIYARPVT